MAKAKSDDERALKELKRRLNTVNKALQKMEGKKITIKDVEKKKDLEKKAIELQGVIAFEEKFKKEKDSVESELIRYQNALNQIQDLEDSGEMKQTIANRITTLKVKRCAIYGEIDNDIFNTAFQNDMKKLEELDKKIRANDSSLKEEEDNIGGANSLKIVIGKYIQELSSLQQEREKLELELNMLKAELIGIEKEIAEFEGRDDLVEAEKDRLNTLYEQQKNRTSDIRDTENILNGKIEQIKEFTSENGQPIRDHLKFMGIANKNNAVNINTEKIAAVQKYKETIQKNSLLMAESQKVLGEIKDKYGIEDISQFTYGNYAEAFRKYKKEIELRHRDYHEMGPLKDAPKTKKEKKPLKESTKVSNQASQTMQHVSGVMTSNNHISQIGSEKSEGEAKSASSIVKEKVVNKKEKRKIKNGYLYRLEVEGDKITEVKEDIQEKDYTKNLNQKIKEELKRIKAEIKEKLSGKEKKEALKKYKMAKYALRINHSPKQKLELLLALKSCINFQEKMDTIKAVPNGNIYQFGKSDLNDFFEDETKEGLFGKEKKELKIKTKEIQWAREKEQQEAINRQKNAAIKREENKEKTVALAENMVTSYNKKHKETGEKEPGE